jgi:hypothetical protein
MFLGLFSTHLPYIIIGIVYVMSFTVASLQFMSNAREDIDAGEVKTNHIFTGTETGNCDGTFQFAGQMHDYAGFTHQTLTSNSPETAAHRKRTPDNPLVTDYHHQTVFARPPPVFPIA